MGTPAFSASFIIFSATCPCLLRQPSGLGLSAGRNAGRQLFLTAFALSYFHIHFSSAVFFYKLFHKSALVFRAPFLAVTPDRLKPVSFTASFKAGTRIDGRLKLKISLNRNGHYILLNHAVHNGFLQCFKMQQNRSLQCDGSSFPSGFFRPLKRTVISFSYADAPSGNDSTICVKKGYAAQ